MVEKQKIKEKETYEQGDCQMVEGRILGLFCEQTGGWMNLKRKKKMG